MKQANTMPRFPFVQHTNSSAHSRPSLLVEHCRRLRIHLLAPLALLLIACSSMNYNPTAIDYKIDESVVKAKSFKQVMIAPINIGKPSRKYLEKSEAVIDRRIKEYLEKNGFEVVSNRPFESRWQQALRKYGQVYDPSTDKYSRYYQSALAETLTQVYAGLPDLDGIIFTDLVERDIMFTDGMQHVARWDGVQRKPKLEGTGDGVPEDFSWQQNVDAVSLVVNVFDRSLKNVFQSGGGLDITSALNLRAARFVRRDDVLDNDTNIDEGIRLALHPLIIMDDYPSKKP